jgi:hypothetical protein
MIDNLIAWLPDAVPFLVAIIGIIMSYEQPKPEHQKRATVILILAGLAGSGLVVWARHRTELIQAAAGDQKFQQMEKSFSDDLKTQLGQQKSDLVASIVSQAKTPAEQAFVNRAVPLEKIDFGFANETTGGYDDTLNTIIPNMILGPARHIGNLRGLPFPTKPVSFKLVGRVLSKLPAKNVHVWVNICDACDWIKLPDGFKAPDYGPNALTQRDKALGDIPAGAILDIGDFQIAMPVSNQDTIEMAVGYTCDNCAPVDRKDEKKLTIHAPLRKP